MTPNSVWNNVVTSKSKSADGIIDGINRLACESGVPSFVYTDQDGGIMKALQEAEINIRDLQYVLFKEKGLNFRVCPVSGHNWSGSCERKKGLYKLGLSCAKLSTCCAKCFFENG